VLLLPVRDLMVRAVVLCVSEGAMFANQPGTFSLTMRFSGECDRRLFPFLFREAVESKLPTLSMSSSLGSSYLTGFFAALLTPLPVLGLRSTSSSSSSSSSAKLSSPASLLSLLSSSMSSAESSYRCLARFLGSGPDDAPFDLVDLVDLRDLNFDF
jgi:hypothetical protein